MLRQIHIAAFDRVKVDVNRLPPPRRLGFDPPRMTTFLPNPVLALDLMRPLQQRQYRQHWRRAALLQLGDDLLGGVSLKTQHVPVQIRRSGDQVQVIFQAHLTVKLKPAAAP